ncbi:MULTISPECIES: hypothetical protein [Streptomyces]|uniref:Glyoxalase-like domain-containing protein n=1 Tax=Streptomyces avermitilis TaxID=33903 RepID=A0A4D4LSQ0_STRAX|nr:hypothetical protein [Streptomyces avermitilis]BBJ51998.1 hypothetical protein SAVMC3_46270 [Streptomyces avermitilis]GDY64035.1 hypothetical protein SAV14893_034280 [Streptomyces avermitilis]GDY75808.1 hypothetical protein SAV31267_052930 [Streptomyces avermitilis]
MGRTRLSSIVFDVSNASDARELAGFYGRLLEYEVRSEEPDRVLT